MPILEAVPLGMPVNTGAINDRVQSVMNSFNKRNRRRLTPFEAKILLDGEENPFYIYNVSPIHEWKRGQAQLGTIVIQKRKWEEVVSIPTVIKGATCTFVKNGLTAEEPFIEGGLEKAEDIVGCSPRADGTHPSSNLTNYGVFISTKPFDQSNLPEQKLQRIRLATGDAKEQLLGEWVVPKHQQKSMIGEATAKLIGDLKQRILEADNWHMGGPGQRAYIGDWHRECLKALNFITGKKEARPWASIMTDDALESCQFCGHTQKPGLPLCANCKNVINQAAYDKLTKKKAE